MCTPWLALSWSSWQATLASRASKRFRISCDVAASSGPPSLPYGGAAAGTAAAASPCSSGMASAGGGGSGVASAAAPACPSGAACAMAAGAGMLPGATLSSGLWLPSAAADKARSRCSGTLPGGCGATAGAAWAAASSYAQGRMRTYRQIRQGNAQGVGRCLQERELQIQCAPAVLPPAAPGALPRPAHCPHCPCAAAPSPAAAPGSPACNIKLHGRSVSRACTSNLQG